MERVSAKRVEVTEKKGKAPSFTLPDLEDKEVRLEEVLADKPALLVFWATWCPYCVAEIPALNKLQEEYGEKVGILAIDIQESKRKVTSFAEKKGITYRILLDSDAEVAQLYDVRGTPTLVLIDQEERVRYQGHLVEEAIEKLIALLGNGPT